MPDVVVWESKSLLESISTVLKLEPPTILLICTSQASFVKTILDSMPDNHPLLIPTLETIERSSKVRIYFCDTLTGLAARIAILETCRHFVLMYPLTLHGGSVHSAQGLAKTTASAVDASIKLGAKLILVEPTTPIQNEMDYTRQQQTGNESSLDPWEQHLPILSATSNRFGSDRGWVGRTVTARQVTERKDIFNWVDPKDKSGEFRRQVSSFRNSIENKQDAKYPPEKGRYHLYVSYACPWAHRTLIYRKLKGLEDILSFSVVGWHLGQNGWNFPTPDEVETEKNVIPDPNHDPPFEYLREVYFESEPDYNARFTVPVLYDKKTKRIVNNESADIIRMLNHCFDSILPEKYASLDLVPKELEEKIDSDNKWIYDDINNGVYKSGFATTQEAYERNVKILFNSLDLAEEHLKSSGPYWFGDRITETDVRLYTTIARFDPVYVQHFKCNIRDIRSGYPTIHKWLRHLYWDLPAFKETTDFKHIKFHYTKSHKQINPLGITPVGPLPDILPKDEEVNAVKAA